MSTDGLKLDASEFIVEKLPERAGGELAGVLLDEMDWEPGVPIEIDVSNLPLELLITSFFATFMRFLHQEDSKFCVAAVNDITWVTQRKFQQNNIQSWMEPWKRAAMNNEQGHPDHVISNVGLDEEGRKIGNCSCGATGCDVDEHLRTVAIQSVSRSKQTDIRKEVKQLVMSWWIFYRLDAIPHVESPEVILGIINEFLADPIGCDESLSKGYDEYGPPKLT